LARSALTLHTVLAYKQVKLGVEGKGEGDTGSYKAGNSFDF